MNKRPFGVHEIKLIIQSRPRLSNGCRVAQHADRSWHFSQITAWHRCGRLVVDAHLETSWTPIDELKPSVKQQVITRACFHWIVLLTGRD